MGTMLGYRCVDCDNLKIVYEGIGMSGQKARISEQFDCPACSSSLCVDSSNYDWQWSITWCGHCRHAFIPLFADYYPGMTFEEASRAHSAQFTVNVTTSEPRDARLQRTLAEFIAQQPLGENNEAMDKVSVVDKIVQGVIRTFESETKSEVRTVRGRLNGLRPCQECGGDTFEEMGGWGFWD